MPLFASRSASSPARQPGRRPIALVPSIAVMLSVLAACSVVGGPAPVPTPLYTLDVGTPTPPPPGEQARRAFVDSVLSGDLTYHATFDGNVFGSLTILSTTGAIDVAGHDYQMAVTYTWPTPGSVRYAVRYVGGTAWVRIDGGQWKKEPRFKPEDTNSPFAFITASRDVKFAKTETVGGQRLHRLTFAKGQLIALHQIVVANLTNEEYKRSNFEVVVNDHGVPVSGTARIEGVGRVSGHQLQEIVIELELTFSKVGSKMVIEALTARAG